MRLVSTAVALPCDRLPESVEFYATLLNLTPMTEFDGSVALKRSPDFTTMVVLRPSTSAVSPAGPAPHQPVMARFTVSNVAEALATADRFRFPVRDVQGDRSKPSAFLTVDPNGVIIEIVAAYDPGELHARIR
jgi:hypothetical protein